MIQVVPVDLHGVGLPVPGCLRTMRSKGARAGWRLTRPADFGVVSGPGHGRECRMGFSRPCFWQIRAQGIRAARVGSHGARAGRSQVVAVGSEPLTNVKVQLPTFPE